MPIDKVAAYAGAMVELYFVADQKIELLEGFSLQEVVGRLDNCHGAIAFDSLVNVLTNDIIRGSWALVLDRAEATPSVVNVWALVQKPGVLDELRVKFDSQDLPVRHQGEFSVDAQHRKARFEEAVGRLPGSVDQLVQSLTAKRMTEARHRGVAHHEMEKTESGSARLYDLKTSGLDWESFRRFLDEVKPVLFDLALIAVGLEYRVDDARQAHWRNVEDFWRRIVGAANSK